jgi:wyosine [tRNA(Phe)-imidazoG37] synthetase (radical SAM superfamily)
MRLIDRPVSSLFTVSTVVEQLKRFKGQAIIQTMMLRGEHDGVKIDNTTPEEIAALIAAYKAIEPREVMLYSLDRSTPEEHLVKVPIEELRTIGEQIAKATGIQIQVN